MRRVTFGIIALLLAATSAVAFRADMDDPVGVPRALASASVAQDVPAGTDLINSQFTDGYAGWAVQGIRNTVWISNGQLVLGLDRDADGVLHEARVQHGIKFTYGVLRARMKFTGPVGGHPALWAQTVPDETGNVYYKGASEIDVVENFRSDRPVWHTVWHSDTGTLTKVQSSTDIDATAWHNYRVEWRPDGYTFKVDGDVVMQTSQGLSSEPHVAILSYLVADWEQKNLADRLGPYRAYVDWAILEANQWTTVS